MARLGQRQEKVEETLAQDTAWDANRMLKAVSAQVSVNSHRTSIISPGAVLMHKSDPYNPGR